MTESAPRSWDPAHAGEAKRVLVIDDDADLRETEVELLREADCEVVEAPDGRRGLEVARGWHPDAIVVDAELRGEVRAPELVDALRADPRTADIEVIIT